MLKKSKKNAKILTNWYTLREIYGSEISQGLISRITDKILPEVNE